MKWIARDNYMDFLYRNRERHIIKVVSGVRRCGKSTLFSLFSERLLTDGVEAAQIQAINFEDIAFEDLQEYHALYHYIEERLAPKKWNYVFLDEIQHVPQFEKAVDSLFIKENVDIYITGSNAFLLSSDLATLFTGRTFEIEVYPFSFAEFMQYFELNDSYAAFTRYIQEGGMAGSYLYKTPETKYSYISDVFNTLIVRDIQKKYKIRNMPLMERLCDFLIDNVSNLTSTRSVAAAFTSEQVKTNDRTISAYIKYLCSAFAFYKVRRYDIQGKRYLASNDKYYLSDHSFKYAKLGTKNANYGRMIENIVAIELLRRGYELYAGVLYKKEIDFVAIKRNEKLYIQVASSIDDPDTFQREVDPLLKIKDAYPKMILTRTRQEAYQYEGVQIVDVADWLLKGM